MKTLPELTKLLITTWASVLALGLSACVSNDVSHDVSASRTAAQEPSAETPQIRVGMTKNQVIAAWGEPSARQVSSKGEIWSWGGQRWLRQIPYAGPFINIQTAKAIFDSNGRVKDFRLSDRGDMMSDIEGMSSGHLPW